MSNGDEQQKCFYLYPSNLSRKTRLKWCGLNSENAIRATGRSNAMRSINRMFVGSRAGKWHGATARVSEFCKRNHALTHMLRRKKVKRGIMSTNNRNIKTMLALHWSNFYTSSLIRQRERQTSVGTRRGSVKPAVFDCVGDKKESLQRAAYVVRQNETVRTKKNCNMCNERVPQSLLKKSEWTNERTIRRKNATPPPQVCTHPNSATNHATSTRPDPPTDM